MSFQVPENREQIYNSLANNVKTNLPKSNPWKRLSWIKAVLIGIACLFYDLYQSLLQLINAFFDDTTYGDYLKRKMAAYGLTLDPALQSSGYITFTGTVGGTITAPKTVVNTDGATYTTQTSGTITNVLSTLASLTYNSGIATATFSTAHLLGTGMDVTIAGATPSELNGVKNITVVDSVIITFATSTGGSGSASGTITCSVDMVSIEIESDETGVDKNMICGDTVQLSSAIALVNNTAYIQVDGISGGADQETEESGRERLIYRKQNPVSNFNEPAIVLEAKKTSFVDRVFVRRITPAVGQVTIYFLKVLNAIPTAGEIATVKAAIDAISPANTDTADIFVYAPTPKVVNFTITSLLPFTVSMKQSVTDKLTDYFLTKTDVGVSITVNELISIIQTTVDTETGDVVTSFTLTAPASTVTPAANEIPTLGTITYA